MVNWSNKILSITNYVDFRKLAIAAFRHQYTNNAIYKTYCNYLKVDIDKVSDITDIPFLPIAFFKSQKVISTQSEATHIFTSSGTTGMQFSQHFVTDINLYEQSFTAAFRQFYGNVENYCILALLPSYFEREGSSLIYMVDKLIKLSNNNDSGFYLNNYNELVAKLNRLNKTNQKVLLIGVTYALLDIAEQYKIDLSDAIIMETGGMKGKRKELIREELHNTLTSAFNVSNIHSEYGMTELLSQAYSFGKGLFKTPPWMQILIRDTYDPFTYVKKRHSGGINVVDLANINSCCFIETKDIGQLIKDNLFTILGRFDNSDIRGCNLLVS